MPQGYTRIICRCFFSSAVATAVLGAELLGCGGRHPHGASVYSANPNNGKYYASWTGSLSDATAGVGPSSAVAPSFNNQTVRQMLRMSLGGESIRIKVSNLFGKAPITFSSVRVARSLGGSKIDVNTDRVVAFGGAPTITVPSGGEVLSDPIVLSVKALSNISVSMYFSTFSAIPTIHELAKQTIYIGNGNQTSAPSIPEDAANQRQSYYALTAVEVAGTESNKVVVTFGDSITDGVCSTADAARRYPNQLDDRLKDAGLAQIGVVNQGISGNRWLHDQAGPSGNNRFERDVLNVAGVSHVIIMLGINDIAFPDESEAVSAEQLIASIRTAVAKSKARGLKVFLGTLLPYKGFFLYTPAGETKRQAVNSFMRNNKDVDGVIDFDLALQNPADITRINPLYDCGDNLHPNDVGYAAMAAAIDSAKLK